MVALATSADVVANLGRALTTAESARVASLLDSASDLVRAYTGRSFGSGEATVRLRSHRGVVRLPESPVVTVDEVRYIGLDGAMTATTEYRYITGNVIKNVCSEWVEVDYTYGGDIPGPIVRRVADMAGRRLTAPTAVAAGATAESVGPYSVTFARDGSGVYLSGMDKVILDTYLRPRIGSASLL